MKHSFQCILHIALLSILGFSALSLAAQQNRQLFRHKGGPRAGFGDEMFMRLIDSPTTIRAGFANVDRSLLDVEEVILLNPFPDVILEVMHKPVAFSGARHRAWFGQLKHIPGSAIFIINGDRISGKITCSMGTFEIFPLGEGECIIVEHHAGNFPDCRAGTQDSLPDDTLGDPYLSAITEETAGFETLDASETQSGEDDPITDRIRIIVAYTASAHSKTQTTYGRTMQEHIDLAIAESNQGYASSGVDTRIELACLYETGFVESYTIGNDVLAFRNDGDGKADEVHQLRADFDADMCSLITDGRDIFWCGDSYGFDYTSRENMFQATSYKCVTSNFSFIHEFGHLQGCRHNDDTQLTPFPYGHGFRVSGDWRTIMALANSTTAVRLNYWSNPEIESPVEPFLPMGTPVDGDKFANDCRSALNAGDDVVINHETTPDSSSAPSNHSFVNDEYADKLVTDTLTVANFTASDGSCVQFRAGSGIVLQSGFQALAGCSFRASLTGSTGELQGIESKQVASADDEISTQGNTAL